MNCEECSNIQAKVICLECDEALCPRCEEAIHRGGKRKTHTRHKLCQNCRTPAIQLCNTCQISICSTCKQSHMKHSIQTISPPSRVAVFWDLNTCRPLRPEDVQTAITSIKEKFEKVECIKAYGDWFIKWKDLFEAAGVKLVICEGLRETEALLIDISSEGSKGLTEILVLCSQAIQIRHHLAQIQANLPSVKLLISSTYYPINPFPVDMLPKEIDGPIKVPAPSTKPSVQGRNSFSEFRSGLKPGEKVVILEACPVLQRFVRKAEQDVSHDQILSALKELAEKGQIMHETREFVQYFSQKFRIATDLTMEFLNSASRLDLVHLTERQFGNIKSMSFISMKLSSLSLESLLWTLRSLRIDEMMPTERAIMSRMKEAFEFKPSPTQWDNLLDACKGFYQEKHHHTKSAPQEKQGIDFSIFMHQQGDSEPLFTTGQIPEFIIRDINDPVTGQDTHTIFPKGEEWESVDQLIKVGDVLHIKQTKEWQNFVEFLERYFSSAGPKIDESTAIPGGRYGCAQFLKLCASSLHSSSLGKLSYMVQLAIDEDLLRYQRTLLVWTPVTTKKNYEEDNANKLRAVQYAVVEVLKENRSGISLAQLPLYLKRKLSFHLDLQELGFSKLKDLLLTIPNVEIVLKGTNHPFAIWKPGKKKTASDTEEVYKSMDEILHDCKQGLPGSRIEMMLHAKFGHPINWSDYKCSNIYDFVQRRAASMFSITGQGDFRNIVKSQFKSSYFPKESYEDDSQYTRGSYSSIFSNSGDLLYINEPPQKVVNVSNLPPELQNNQNIHFSPLSNFEGHEEQQRKFIETLLCEEDMSNTLQGSDPPHYRTDSVEYHHLPISGNYIGNVEGHKNALSEDFQEFVPDHNRKYHSSLGGFSISPPPGFGP